MAKQSKKRFNKEHAIPKSFGTFGTQSPTLQIVCENCNQYFGNTIDRELTRSGLNVHKFLSGNKKTLKAQKILKISHSRFQKDISWGCQLC